MKRSKDIKICTIVGARPQFIKSAPLSKYIQSREGISEFIIHTGQHFDANMSSVFFEQLNIPKPKYFLNINGASHGEMTGRMLIEIEKILIKEKPKATIVFGDTNSTLAGALAATKLNIPVIHIEAGLRSKNMLMPEEINRIMTDSISEVLFCPSEDSRTNLILEGLNNRAKIISVTGDIMHDSLKMIELTNKISSNFFHGEDFCLLTLHRAENVDNPDKLLNILNELNELARETNILFPVHPRTKSKIEDLKINLDSKIRMIEPLGYFEMINAISSALLIITDSGGLQKEAYFLNKYCLTVRDETEWVELVQIGANVLVGSNANSLIKAFTLIKDKEFTVQKGIYGDGRSSQLIVEHIIEFLAS